MTPALTALRQELAAWRAEGHVPQFWWRDDDAVAATTALDEMIAFSMRFEVDVHLAVIPKHAEASLVEVCAAHPELVPMVHGWAHDNHAPKGQKKAEFGHPRPALEADAAAGLERLRSLFGSRLLPCFVPPWNRITPELLPVLPRLGYGAVSTFTPRSTRLAAPGLVQINTHIDPINWRDGGGLADVDGMVLSAVRVLRDGRLAAEVEAEPLGVLTHHLVQDTETWGFVAGLFEVLLEGGAEVASLFEVRNRFP